MSPMIMLDRPAAGQAAASLTAAKFRSTCKPTDWLFSG